MELKKYRRIAGLTQQQLSDRTATMGGRVDATLISKLESGRQRTATFESIVRLARALNLEPTELQPVTFLTLLPASRAAEDEATRTP